MEDLVALAHPSPHAKTTLATDASSAAVGAVLQQEIDGELTPIGFFSKGFNHTQKLYSTYDRELMAIFLAIKHYAYFLEGRKFTVLTDHQPLTSALATTSESLSPRVSRQLSFISQFDCTIEHIKGSQNSVADALSRSINSVVDIIPGIDYLSVARAQIDCPELEQHLNPNYKSPLKLKPLPLAGSDAILWCDVSTGVNRPFIPSSHRKQFFDKFHSPSHPGIRATQRLLTRRAVWPFMKKMIRDWTTTCEPCQKNKVTRHVKSRPGEMPTPTGRFEIVHVDLVGPLPPSRDQIYILTCIDRHSRWIEAIPLGRATAETVALAFMSGWVSRFGAPKVIISDRGAQFDSTVWLNMLSSIGATRNRTTAYHPESNGMIERIHRRLKEGIKCQPEPHRWVDNLPQLLLYLHATPSTDTNVSPAEHVFGEDLRLPGQFCSDSERPSMSSTLSRLLDHAGSTRAPPPRPAREKPVYIPPNLRTVQEVLVRVDAVRTGLQPPYEGPYKVLQRRPKFFIVEKNFKPLTVSIDRLKAFYKSSPSLPAPGQQLQTQPLHEASSDNTQETSDQRVVQPAANEFSRQQPESTYTTRSGRQSRCPQKYSPT